MGYFEASSTLSGCIFEQALIILLEDKIRTDGFVSVKKKTEKGIFYNRIETTEKLSCMNIGILISIMSHYDMLPEEEYLIAKNLQIIRNALVHNMLPKFKAVGAFYEARLTEKNIITLDIEEITEHKLSRQSAEIWAHYIITRTKKLIEFIFKDRANKLQSENLIKK